MKRTIIGIIIEDVLALNRLSISESDLAVLQDFCCDSNSKYLEADNQKMQAHSTVTRDINGNILSESGTALSFKCLDRKQLNEFIESVTDTNDLVTAAAENSIPLRRLTCDYESIHFLPESYIKKITRASKILEPVLTFVKYNNIVETDKQGNMLHENINVLREFNTPDE